MGSAAANLAYSTVAFRVLARAGLSLLRLLIEEADGYPCRLFTVVDDPSAAAVVLADPACLMDKFFASWVR